MAIKPGGKFYLRSLMGVFKLPFNSPVVPTKAFRKRPQCPKNLCRLWSFFSCGYHQPAEMQHIHRGWHFGCICARDGCSFCHPRAPTVLYLLENCSTWTKVRVRRLIQNKTSNLRIMTLIIHRAMSFPLLRGKEII